MNLSIDQLRKMWYRIHLEKTIDVITVIDKGTEYYGILLDPYNFLDLFPKDNYSDYILWKMENTDVNYTTRTETIQEFRFFTNSSTSNYTISTKEINMTGAYFYMSSANKYFNIRFSELFGLMVKVIYVNEEGTIGSEKVADYSAVKSLEDTCDYIESYIEEHRFSPRIDLVRNGLDIYSITEGSSLSEMMCLVEDIVDSKTDQLTIRIHQ